MWSGALFFLFLLSTACFGVLLDSVGEKPSLALLQNGFPAVVFHRNGSLFFLRASDSSGGVWDSSSRVSIVSNLVASSVGRVLALVGGNPAVCAARINSTTNKTELVFARANDATGLVWSAPTVVASSINANVGEFCSLNVLQGFPRIAYFDAEFNRTAYVRASDALGAGIWTRVLIAQANSGQFLSFSSLGGRFPLFASSFSDGAVSTQIYYTHGLENDTSLTSSSFAMYGSLYGLFPAQQNIAPCVLELQSPSRPGVFHPVSPTGWIFEV